LHVLPFLEIIIRRVSLSLQTQGALDSTKGIYEEATSHAMKRLIAWQLAEAMKARKISKAEMARRLGTSRTQVARCLDPENSRIQLDTIQ
jgi:hypothetical protein